jgi:transglutaminase-like putative cysteine protease
MRYRVSHVTRYRYSNPVYLEPHTLRLTPRGGSQRLLSHEVHLDPVAAGVSKCLDAEGNAIHFCWFAEPAAHLTVRSDFEVETTRENPFDFVLPDLSLATLPIVYPGALQPALEPHRKTLGRNEPVAELARSVARDVEWQTLPFLFALCRKIFGMIEHGEREHGDPQPAELTLELRTGACRDVAVLFIDACRSLGLAARFVSGYEALESVVDRHNMHAWAEVFLPGGGWRGYDASRGLAVAGNHIAVAASHRAAGAAPVEGSFRGQATAAMEFEIQVTQL